MSFYYCWCLNLMKCQYFLIYVYIYMSKQCLDLFVQPIQEFPMGLIRFSDFPEFLAISTSSDTPPLPQHFWLQTTRSHPWKNVMEQFFNWGQKAWGIPSWFHKKERKWFRGHSFHIKKDVFGKWQAFPRKLWDSRACLAPRRDLGCCSSTEEQLFTQSFLQKYSLFSISVSSLENISIIKITTIYWVLKTWYTVLHFLY